MKSNSEIIKHNTSTCNYVWKEKGTYWFSGNFGTTRYKCNKCKCIGLASSKTVRPISEFTKENDD